MYFHTDKEDWILQSWLKYIIPLQLEWLLSGKCEVNEEEEDFETGLDPNSYVYKAIMSNPVVQLTLTNTKSLIGE
jgi:hypothetical protein